MGLSIVLHVLCIISMVLLVLFIISIVLHVFCVSCKLILLVVPCRLLCNLSI
jgi:hypothetical protein